MGEMARHIWGKGVLGLKKEKQYSTSSSWLVAEGRSDALKSKGTKSLWSIGEYVPASSACSMCVCSLPSERVEFKLAVAAKLTAKLASSRLQRIFYA